MKIKTIFVITYIFIGIILGWVSFYSRPMKVNEAAKFHQTLWENLSERGKSGNSEEPLIKIHSSRVLFPALMQIPQKIGLSTEQSFSLVRLITIILALILFHSFLLEWFSDELAFCGTLFLAATVPLTFNQWFELPTDFIEIIVFTLGVWAIYRAQYLWLCLIIIVGTFSRESTAVLPFFLFFGLVSLKDFKWLLPVAAVGFSWLLPLLFLRWWVGAFEAHGYGFGLSHNLQGLQELLVKPHPYNNFLFWIYLFGTFWLLPFFRWKSQPVLFKRLLISLPIFLAVYIFVGGFLDEPREIVNLYPLLVPASLFALFPNSSFIKNDEPKVIEST